MNIKDKLEKIDKDHLFILKEIGKVSKEINQKSYLVGGMVRDLLLGFDNLDIDVVVENNAALLADALIKKFSNCELSAKHDRFHTAKVIFHINDKKIPIDLATTREETYDNEKLAPLPEVTISELKKDLIRRDFTINALAVSLLPEDFGEVVDLFNGLSDLKNKKIKILHEKSFIDDPTRMIRAIRFATKLGFKIDENTERFLKEAIESGQFDNLIKKIRGDRVKIEIRYLFNLSNINEAIDIFFKSGVYRMIGIPYRDMHPHVPIGVQNQWLIALALIIHNSPDYDEIMKNLQMTGDEIKIITNAFNAYNLLSTNKYISDFQIYKIFSGFSLESIDILKCLGKDVACNVFLKTSKIKLHITGQDLIDMGISPGKKIGEILDKILEFKIQNPNMSKEDEIKICRDILNTPA